MALTISVNRKNYTVDVDGDNEMGDLCDLQREPAIAAAQVNYIHAGAQVDGPQHL